MATTSKNLAQAVVEEYARSVAMGERPIPPALNGMISPSGYFDPSQVQALYSTIQQADPAGAQAAQFRTGDIRDASTAGMGAGDTLTWKSAADENDWGAPLGMLAAPFATQYLSPLLGAGGANAAVGAGRAALSGGNPLMGAVGGYAGGVASSALGGAVGADYQGFGEPGTSYGGDAGGDVSWGANPRFDGPFIGDELNPPTLTEANGGVPQGPFIGDDLNPPTSISSLNADRTFYGMPTTASDIPGPRSTGGLAELAKSLGVSTGVLQALGIGTGALLGSMGGQKQAGTTTTTQDIPDWLKPYAMNLIQQGQNTANANPVNASTFAGADATLAGILNGSIANPHLGDNNPYFEATLNKSLNDVQGRVNNQFRNNAFGGSANQELLTRNLGDQSNAARFGEYDKQTNLYESNLNRRTNVATQMPAYSTTKTNATFAPLNAQKGLLNFGGSQTSQPYFTNPTGSALYGGLLGSQLFGGK